MEDNLLSEAERARGLKLHIGHQFCNGLGFNFIGQTPVLLLAIEFGASNLQIGYLTSLIYIAGVVLALVPVLFSGILLTRLHFWAWLFRGLICISYTALWFISGNSAVILIMVVYSVFCICRIIGVALYKPIMRMLSTPVDRGRVVAKSSIALELAMAISRAISFGVTSIRTLGTVPVLLMLQYLGVVMNTIAAIYAGRVPCRQRVEYEKGRSIAVIFREAVANRECFSVIVINWLTVSLMILFAFMVPFLKREALLGSNWVFLFAITVSLSSICAGLFVGKYADRVGSKPLLTISSIALIPSALAWALLPGECSIPVLLGMGFATGFFLNTSNVLSNRLIVRVLPDGQAVGYNSMINFAVAVISVVIGLGGGYLADLHGTLRLLLPNGYSLTFLLCTGVAILSLVFSFRIVEPSSLSGRETIALMFAPPNFQAFWHLGRIIRPGNGRKRSRSKRSC